MDDMSADEHLGPQFAGAQPPLEHWEQGEQWAHHTDAQWESAYNNSAEHLYPDAFHPATGRPVRDLTNDEDDAVIKHATQSLRDQG